MEFKDEDVTNFLALFIGIGGTHYVSNDDEKTIRLAADGKIETTEVNGVRLPMTVYGTKLPNSVIVNPFSDGIAEGHSKWFYQHQNVILSKLVIAIMREILEAAHAQGTKKATPAKTTTKKGAKAKQEPAASENDAGDDPVDMRLVEFISPYIELVDDKMLAEFNQITSDYRKFISINWLRSKRVSTVTTLLFSATMKRGFPNIRVKSWEVFENLLASILQTDKMSDLDESPPSQDSPSFESFIAVILNIYTRMTDYVLFMMERRPNLPNIPEIVATIKKHMQFFGNYFAKARWCSSSMSALSPSGPQQVAQQPAGSVPWESNAGAMMTVGGVYAPQQGPGVPVMQPMYTSPPPMMNSYYQPQAPMMVAQPVGYVQQQPLSVIPTVSPPMQSVYAVGMATAPLYPATAPMQNQNISDSVQF